MKSEMRTFCGSGITIEGAVDSAEKRVGDFLKDKIVHDVRTALASGRELSWGFTITVVYGVKDNEHRD